MENQEQLISILIDIRKMLTVLSYDKYNDFKKYIEQHYLTTVIRRRMYELFNGKNSLKTIGSKVGTSSEAVRQFAVSLEKDGLLRFVTHNNSKCPEKLF